MKMSMEFFLHLLTAATGVAFQQVMGSDGGHDVSCVNMAVDLEAQPGENVTIECRYPTTAGSIFKHFCREGGNFTCTTQISVFKDNKTIRGRFSIRDSKEHGVYAVTISALSHNDSGRYRCFTEKADATDATDATRECLTQINLTVSTERNIKTMEPTNENGNATKGVVGGVVAALVFLLASLAAMLVLRYKQKVQVRFPAGYSPEPGTNAGSRIEEHNNEEMQTLNGNLATACTTVDHPTDVPTYCTVKFPKSTAAVPAESSKLCDANDCSSSAFDCTSASEAATFPAAAEATIYSVIRFPSVP